MIGRSGPVKGYDLIRWARDQADREHSYTEYDEHGKWVADHKGIRLRQLEAHILVLLAIRGDKQCKCYPSIARLAKDAGLDVYKKTNGKVSYGNSSVSAALKRLREVGLIWRKQAGPGNPTVTELLYRLPSATQEGKEVALPSCDDETLPSGIQEAELPEGPELLNGSKNNYNDLPGELPSCKQEGNISPSGEAIRRTIEESLAEVAA